MKTKRNHKICLVGKNSSEDFKGQGPQRERQKKIVANLGLLVHISENFLVTIKGQKTATTIEKFE